MARKWLTTDDLGALVCAPVYFPSGSANWARLLGALSLLAHEWNWEQYGTETTEDTANAWLDAMSKTVDGGVCMPAGTIFMFAGTTPPDGALICDGSILSQSEYPALFDVIGTSYGAGGAGTFALPDMRARFPVGNGDGGEAGNYSLADQGGEAQHTLTTNEMPSHRHTEVQAYSLITMGTTPSPIQFDVRSSALTYGEQTYPAGGDAAHENRPPFLSINFCICYR